MPSQEIKQEPSYVKTKIVVLIVLVVAGLGLAGGYIISPIIHAPEPVYLTTNVTNDSTYTPTTHTKTHTQSSNNKTIQKAAQNATLTQNTNTKTTNSSQSTT